jgi:hypothetical protein
MLCTACFAKLQKLACERLQAQTFAIFNAVLCQQASQKAAYIVSLKTFYQTINH